MRFNIPCFETPSTLPDERECRSISIPASQEWLGVFNSAIALLANPLLWQQVNDTDMTAEDASEQARLIYEAWLSSGYLGDCDVLPPPFVWRYASRTVAPPGANVPAVAGTWYALTWTDAFAADDWIELDADTIRFRCLQDVEIDVEVWSSIYNVTGTMLRFQKNSVVAGFSQFAMYDVNSHWTLTLNVGDTISFDQYFANGNAAGREFAYGVSYEPRQLKLMYARKP